MTEYPSSVLIETGSYNVFADLGLKDAPELKMKSEILSQISSIVRQRQLTDAQAAQLLGLPLSDASGIHSGRLLDSPLERLITMMNKLGRDVEISFKTPLEGREAGYVVQREEPHALADT
jgi:predicted XRE-type DNA-binding protein